MKLRRGLTLPELLMSMFVLTLIVFVVVNMFISISQLTRTEEARILVGEESAAVFGRLDQTLRQARDVQSSATVNSTLYTTSGTTAVVSLPALLATGTLSADPAEIDIVVVTLDTSNPDNHRLRLLLNPHANSTREALDVYPVNYVQDLYFRYTDSTITDAKAVTLTVSVRRTSFDRDITQKAILYAAFRNRI